MRWIEDTGPVEDTPEEEQYHDPRAGHGHPDDRPIADVLEQEVPVDGMEGEPVGRDDERVDPVDPADSYDAEPAEPDSAEAWVRRSA
jgi:hypothetical protein